MKKAVVYDANDIKKILADLHGVAPDQVIKNMHSYTVVLEEEPDES